MYLKWSRCPYCKSTIQIGVEPGGPWSTKLGKPTYTICNSCGGKISDGMMEWPEMGFFRKANEVILTIFVGLVIFPLIVTIILMLGSFVFDKEPNFLDLLKISMIGFPYALFVFYIRIKDSIKRYNERT